MVILEEITKQELPDLIRIAYEGDKDLLDKYHVDKFDIHGAVASTLFMIAETENGVDMTHYKVALGDISIGYISVFENFLYSFGINKEYRKKEILIEWFEKVKEVLGYKFITMIYPNNSRAINFLKKQGMKIVNGIKEDVITLINE